MACLKQGSQTLGSWDACGLQDVIECPLCHQQFLNYSYNCSLCDIKALFALICGPRRHFFSFSAPRALFLSRCGPRIDLSLRYPLLSSKGHKHSVRGPLVTCLMGLCGPLYDQYYKSIIEIMISIILYCHYLQPVKPFFTSCLTH